MTYEQALAFLDSLVDFEKLGASYFGRDRFQLASVRALLEALGNPQGSFRVVHIAGTKGKGSTAAMLASILGAQGLRAGLFTQPHLVDIRERTLVDGRPLSREQFAEAVAAVRPHVEELNARLNAEPLTFYEAHLATALLAFAHLGVAIAVIETGLGGRLDATNALQPVATAITRIDYDHTDILGDTLPEIAAEKAGILKRGVPCVFAPQEAEVLAVLRERAHSVGAPIIPFPDRTPHPDGSFDVHARREYRGLRLPLAGDHQLENAAVALALAEALADYGTVIGEDAVREGLASVQWPGRFQVIEGRPTLVLDVAHNPVSARVLRRGLEELLDARGGPLLHLVVGLAKDKDVAGFVQSLAPLAASVVCTRSHSGRAAAPEAVAKAARGGTGEVSCCATVAEAVARARDGAGPGDVVCITGSFHVVGEAMAALGINPMELD